MTFAWLISTAVLYPACIALCLYFVRAILRFLLADCDVRTLSATIKPAHFRAKVVWITGATTPIGAALATALAEQGALLILSSPDEHQLTQTAKSLPCSPQHIHVLPLDLMASSDHLEAVAYSASSVFGRLDYLFNTAAISTHASALDLDLDRLAQVMNFNFVAPVTLARACVPALAANPGCPGAIVNTISIEALIPQLHHSSYSASKAALAAYFQAFQLEHQQQQRIPRLRILNIYPGAVRPSASDLAIAQGGKPLGHADPISKSGLQPSRVADRILAAVSNGIADAVIATPSELFKLRLYAWTRHRIGSPTPITPTALGE